MKVLHICNAFQTNPMYLDLFMRLEHLGIKEIVLSPGVMVTSNVVKGDNISIFYYCRSQNIIKRLLWRKKISSLTEYIDGVVNVKDLALIHAHTLFSDGAVAYELFKKYKIPYLVAVRNTDLNVFFKYMLWERGLGYNILKHASKIVLISHANKEQLYRILPRSLKEEINPKVEIIPNGINQYWLTNINTASRVLGNEIRFTYVGDICTNKNIDGTLKAISIVNKEYDVKYTVIGDKKDEKNSYVNNIRNKAETCPYFILKERCNKEDLLQYFRNSTDVFIMNSHNETFGLSYIEALTQGVPIIYSKGQGVDGYFNEGLVGYHADASDANDIAQTIKKTITNYSTLIEGIKKVDFGVFDWANISLHYKTIYESILL